MSSWTLFSNHGHVLVCLARDSEARLRDVAADVGITERAVQKIVRDLQDGGMISIKKIGRRNSYRIHKKQTLRHELEASCKLRDLLKVVNKDLEQTQSMENGPGSSSHVGLHHQMKSTSFAQGLQTYRALNKIIRHHERTSSLKARRPPQRRVNIPRSSVS